MYNICHNYALLKNEEYLVFAAISITLNHLCHISVTSSKSPNHGSLTHFRKVFLAMTFGERKNAGLYKIDAFCQIDFVCFTFTLLCHLSPPLLINVTQGTQGTPLAPLSKFPFYNISQKTAPLTYELLYKVLLRKYPFQNLKFLNTIFWKISPKTFIPMGKYLQGYNIIYNLYNNSKNPSVREGCRKKTPEKMWPFAKPPLDPPPHKFI